MKLRIKGNTIRFRLTQTEIDQVREGFVEDKTQFPGGNSLIYRIEKGDLFNVQYTKDTVLISVPSAIINDWATTDTVSISKKIPLTNGDLLDLSLEKDFQCLTERPNEDESDMFPNPLEKHNKC